MFSWNLKTMQHIVPGHWTFMLNIPSEETTVPKKKLFLITNRIIGNGFFFMQVLHMFHNIYFLFGPIVTERTLEHCRLSTLVATVSPQGAVSKVNFPTAVALEDSCLVCCWVCITGPAPCCKYNKCAYQNSTGVKSKETVSINVYMCFILLTYYRW
jgi:hypothetical protein